MGSFPYPDLEGVLKIDFRMKNGTHSLKVKTTSPPYSRENKNKYAVGTEWAGVLNVLWSIK